jgi:AAA+ ATPase superfamily predicted ATPase
MVTTVYGKCNSGKSQYIHYAIRNSQYKKILFLTWDNARNISRFLPSKKIYLTNSFEKFRAILMSKDIMSKDIDCVVVDIRLLEDLDYINYLRSLNIPLYMESSHRYLHNTTQVSDYVVCVDNMFSKVVKSRYSDNDTVTNLSNIVRSFIRKKKLEIIEKL